MEMANTANPSVLAFVRTLRSEQCRPGETAQTLLCVFSFAHHPTTATIDVDARFAGATLSDVFGGAEFPAVGSDGRVTLSLGTQGFYWLAVD
jgi:maltose alpha-D-glucosyltransferase/alpha-amylase